MCINPLKLISPLGTALVGGFDKKPHKQAIPMDPAAQKATDAKVPGLTYGGM